MKKKRFSVEVDEETALLIRERAKNIGMNQGKYIKLCVIDCTSDVGLKKD